MSVIIKIIATVPSSILFVIGFLLIIVGSSSNNQGLVDMGIWSIIGGFILQVLWIFMKGGKL